MYHWLFLIIAIVTEVCGTLAMKYSANGMRALGLAIMYLMLGISYTSLAIAVKRIPLVVAYGMWESLGLILIAIFSNLLFLEPLGFIKMSGILITVAGIILLEYGTDASDH
ncbi:MAG: multidrug transporter subunit MdtJ [Verrucomicrobia bacterium]|nr:MAG: multidrug transporter subunit MdtJ [Verrucomicrobiota bacterium]